MNTDKDKKDIIDHDEEKPIFLSDIENIVLFKDWLKTNLSLYYKKEVINKVHLNKYIEYLEQKVRVNHLKDKHKWLEALSKLKEDVDREEKE